MFRDLVDGGQMGGVLACTRRTFGSLLGCWGLIVQETHWRGWFGGYGLSGGCGDGMRYLVYVGR